MSYGFRRNHLATCQRLPKQTGVASLAKAINVAVHKVALIAALIARDMKPPALIAVHKVALIAALIARHMNPPALIAVHMVALIAALIACHMIAALIAVHMVASNA